VKIIYSEKKDGEIDFDSVEIIEEESDFENCFID